MHFIQFTAAMHGNEAAASLNIDRPSHTKKRRKEVQWNNLLVAAATMGWQVGIRGLTYWTVGSICIYASLARQWN